MIDFLVKPFFLRQELATKLRFEKCLHDRYSDVLEDAQNFCTLIRQSKQYKRAKETWKEYQDKSFDVLYANVSDDCSYAHSYCERLKEEEKELAGMHVECYNALENRFSFSSLVETYRNLVIEITRNTSYDPRCIMLYSDHEHHGYRKEDYRHYIGYCGYSEEHFTEYCTTYDLMCLIGDYCAFSHCDGLVYLYEDDYIKSSYKDLNTKTSEEVYKEAREMLSGMYDLEDGK